MRRYDDPVQVRGGAAPGRLGSGPERLFQRVRAVLAHGVATGAWTSPGARAGRPLVGCLD